MKKVVAAVFLLLGLMIPRFSNAAPNLNQGTVELGVASDSFGFEELSPFVGYFLTNNLEGVVHFNISNSEIDFPGTTNDSKTDSIALSANLLYNFSTGTNIVPALGGGVEFFNEEEGDFETDGFAFVVNAKVRFFVKDNASINLDASYLLGDVDLTSTTGASTTIDVEEFNLGLSYSIFF